MKRTHLISALLCIAFALPLKAQNTLTVSNVEAGPGKTIIVPVSMTNAEEIVAAQFTVTLPYAKGSGDISLATNRADGHTVTMRSLGSNRYLIVIASMTNKPLRGNSGTLFNIPMTIDAAATEGTENFITIDADAVLARKDGSNALTGTARGKVTVGHLPSLDLTVSDISATEATFLPSDSIDLTWKVNNIGDAATGGGWTEHIYLYNPMTEQDVFMATVYCHDEVAGGATLTRQAKIAVPAVPATDGSMQLRVTVAPNSQTGEIIAYRGNNTALSSDSYTLGKRLLLACSQNNVSESYTGSVRFTLTRSGDRALAQMFSLSTLHGMLTVPATVTIPAGQSAVYFNATVVNNTTVNAFEAETIQASAAAGYAATSCDLAIEDDENFDMTLAFTSDDVTEGETTLLRITRPRTNVSETFSIISNTPKRVNHDYSVEFPVGVATQEVAVEVVEDEVADVEHDIVFSVTANRYNKAQIPLIVQDNDMPSIEMTLSPSAISESAGPGAIVGHIIRTGVTTNTVTVKLADNSGGRLYYSSNAIVMDPGVTEAEFSIGVVDNNYVEGEAAVDITADVYVSSCSCSIGKGQGHVSQRITLYDNDGPSLQLTSSTSTVPETSTTPFTLTITRNTTPTDALTVALECDHASDFQFPSTVTIPAGQLSASVTVSVVNNNVVDGDRTAVFTATAADYGRGIAWVMVSDRTLPDLECTTVVCDPAVGIAGEKTGLVHVSVANNGAAAAEQGFTVKLFYCTSTIFSNSKQLAAVQHSEALAVGQTATLDVPFTLPTTVGDLYLFAQIDDVAEKELSTVNNTSNATPFRCNSPWQVNVSTDKTRYLPGDTLHITGIASGKEVAEVAMDVWYTIDGVRRTSTVTTDVNGAFTYDFVPEAWQMGAATLGAAYPSDTSDSDGKHIDIVNLRKTTHNYKDVTWDFKIGETLHGAISITNPCSFAQTGIHAVAENLPDGASITFGDLASIAAGGKADLEYTITGTEPSGDDYDEVVIRITSNEGANSTFSGFYYANTIKGRLKASISTINTTMCKGTSRNFSFEISNIGEGETGPMRLYLPSTDWLSAATPIDMPTMLPGDTTTIVLTFTPGNDREAQTHETGYFSIGMENGEPLSISYFVETVSESTGTLIIDVCDELTYNTEEAPHLQGANVKVRHPFTGEVLYEGVSDQLGHVIVQGIPEGLYTLKVTALDHNGYQNNITVEPGRTTLKTVDLTSSLIVIDWDVKETTFEDHYSIVTTAVYETRVPRPIIEVEFPEILPFEDQLFTITATNKGFINATNCHLEWSMPEGVEIEVLNYEDSLVIPAKSTYVFFCRMTVDESQQAVARRGGGAQIGNGQRSSLAGCLAGILGLYYAWYCGHLGTDGGADNVGKAVANYTSGECNGIPGIGSGGTPKSGGNKPSKGGGGNDDEQSASWGNGGWGGGGARDCSNCNPKICYPFTEDAFWEEARKELDKSWKEHAIEWGVKGGIKTVKKASKLTYPSGLCLMDAIDPCGFAPHPQDYLSPSRRRIGSAIVSPDLANYNPFAMELGQTLKQKFIFDTRLPSFAQPFCQLAYYVLQYYHYNKLFFEELFANERWWNNEEEFESFWEGLAVVDPLTKGISEQYILDNRPTGITDAQAHVLWQRLDNTRRLEAGEQVENTNVINTSLLKWYSDICHEAQQLALDKGYPGLLNMWKEEFPIYEERVKDKSSNVCATVTLQFEQDLYFTRQAFEGTLTINNSTARAMTDIDLSIVVKDEYGVIATSHEFQVNRLSTDGFDGDLDGTWSLEGGKSGTAKVQFIPTRFAAPTANVPWSFGGSVSYTDPFSGLRVTIELSDVTLTVKPSPFLKLDYFLQRDVIGDDPLTEDVIEPSEEGEFSLLIHNTGYGDATDVRMVTKQPKIVENEKGLFVDFAFTSSALNGQEKVLSLGETMTTNFGTIRSQDCSYAQWFLEGTLMGHFISYDVSVTHVTSFGNPDLNLLDTVKVHELIRSIDQPGTGLKGFLVNDIADADDTPDMIYLSDGSMYEVYSPFKSTTERPSATQLRLTVTPSRNGWNYGIINDPFNGKARLLSVERESDHVVLPARNFWLTYATLRDGNDPLYENLIHFADEFGGEAESYLLTFEPQPDLQLQLGSVEGIPATGHYDVVEAPITLYFNKPYDAATFTTDDLSFVRQGKRLDPSGILITHVSDSVATLDISGYEPGDGYHEITVQTATMADRDGFPGANGKAFNWIQFLPAHLQYAWNTGDYWSINLDGHLVNDDESAFPAGLAANDSVLSINLANNDNYFGTLLPEQPNAVVYCSDADLLAGTPNLISNGVCSSLVLTPGKPYAPTRRFIARKATFPFTMTAAGLSTLVLPYNCVLPTDLEAFSLVLVGDDVVLGEKVNAISAHQPVLLRGPQGDYTFEGKDVNVTVNNEPMDELLIANYTGATVPEGSYVLQNQGGEVAFYRVGKGSTITLKPFRAYLTAPSHAGILRFGTELPDATLVETLPMEPSPKAATDGQLRIVDMAGRTLYHGPQTASRTTMMHDLGLTPGVYIVNGTKTVVKP